ncbi:MAG: hypothetical protein O3C40_00490 [Planctomycetota bacterium]|nr:hypothetical protein [Planctomycetota bacterium]
MARPFTQCPAYLLALRIRLSGSFSRMGRFFLGGTAFPHDGMSLLRGELAGRCCDRLEGRNILTAKDVWVRGVSVQRGD